MSRSLGSALQKKFAVPSRPAWIFADYVCVSRANKPRLILTNIALLINCAGKKARRKEGRRERWRVEKARLNARTEKQTSPRERNRRVTSLVGFTDCWPYVPSTQRQFLNLEIVRFYYSFISTLLIVAENILLSKCSLISAKVTSRHLFETKQLLAKQQVVRFARPTPSVTENFMAAASVLAFSIYPRLLASWPTETRSIAWSAEA